MNPTVIRQWLEERVLHADSRTMPGYMRLLVYVARMIFAVGRDIARGHLTLRAMSLVYTTLLSMVPLLAVSFSVLKAFGVHNQIEPTLAGFLAPLGPRGDEITQRIVEFVENMQVGVLGAVGLALLLYTVIALMQKIEQSFNATWRINRPRTIAQRFSDYLSVLLIGPVLVFTSLGITATVLGSDIVRSLSEIGGLGTLISLLSRLVPYALIILAFTFVYLFVPNTRVRAQSALVGALVAGVLWQTSGWAFASFVAGSARYAAIYSAFAALIMFMIWLYVSWLILLIGASVAYYHQHPRRLEMPDDEVRLSPRLFERIGIDIMALVTRRFYQRRKPVSGERLAFDLDMSLEAVEQALEALVAAGLLRRISGGDEPGYQPATPAEETTLSELLAALRRAGEGPGLRPAHGHSQPAVDTLLEELDACRDQYLNGRTLRDLVIEADRGADAASTPRTGSTHGH